MSINCSTRTFEIGQFTSLFDLFSEHFPPHDKVLSKTYSEWLYLNNPFGPAKIVTAKEEEDGCWLGFLAMVPVSLARRDEVRTGYFVVNVLVQRKQRGKNIFGMMIEKAIEYVKTERAILMGHPNSMAYGAWQRAAMRFQPPLKSYFVIPKIIQWNTSVMEVRKVSGLEQLINGLNEQGRKSQEWQVVLSVDYLEWRYLRHPTNDYCLRSNKRQERSCGIYRFQENARWPEYADRSIHAKWLHGGEFRRCAPVHGGVPAGSSHAGLPQALGRAHKKDAFFFLHGLRETNWRVRGHASWVVRERFLKHDQGLRIDPLRHPSCEYPLQIGAIRSGTQGRRD